MEDKVFAFVVDEDIIHFMKVSEKDTPGLLAGLRSDPKVIEMSEFSEIMQDPRSWKYVNDKFELKTFDDYVEDYEVE